MLDAALLGTLVGILTSPYVIPVLLALAILGILFEFKAGTFGLGLLVSFVSLGAFFGSAVYLGHAGGLEITLLAVGALLLAAEAILIPGIGFVGVAGLAAVIASVVFTLNAIPGVGAPAVVGVLGASTALTLSVFLAWMRHLPNSTRFAGLFLRHATDRSAGYISAPERLDLVGRTGMAVTALRPSGTVEVDGERIDVVTEGEFLPGGTAVTVVRAESYRHVVRALPTIPDSQT